MKKINNIKQLQTEKDRITSHQEELENNIRSNWKELKVSRKPGSTIKNSVIKAIINKTRKELNGKSVLKSTFIYGLTLLARKYANKLVQKAGQVFMRR